MAQVAAMTRRFARFGALSLCCALSGLSVTAAALAMGALAACASNDAVANGTTSATSEAGDDGGGAGAGGGDEAGSATDSGLDGGRDGAASDGASGPIDGPGADGATCAFNRDCHLALRCECNETTGCACKPGARGTGKNGIDPCTSGNECASSVCVEGPPDAGSFCSDECVTAAQCTGVLPLCSDIAFVGRICIRTTPQ